MTFKDLKKIVSLDVTQQQFKLFQSLQDKPFWIWNKEEHKQEEVCIIPQLFKKSLLQ